MPLLVAGLLAGPLDAPVTATDPVGPAWREDLRFIARELPRIHPNAFARLPRRTWDSAVKALDRRLPGLNRSQAIVSLMELVALVHDGHTSINPMFDQAMQWHYYPVRFAWFSDGLFIQSADPAYANAVGGRVLRLGRESAEAAMAAVTLTLPNENEWYVRAYGPARLSLVELLDGLGLVADPEALPVVIERDGRQETIVLHPAGALTPRGHDPAGPFGTDGWIDMRQAEPPLWQRQPDRVFWAQYLPETRMLYVCYRGVIDAPPGNTVFWRSVFAMADSLPVERVVIDLRSNGGGNSFFNRQVVRGIVARPSLDRPDRLFVLTSGRTFSAAMNLVQDLEQWTNATFVGEPTGNATNFFGDHRQLTLPRSGLTLNVSTLPWYAADPRDQRDFKAPQLFTPFASEDYRTGRDPALAVILDPTARPTLAGIMAPLVAGNDTAGVLPAIRRFREMPIHRFRQSEAEVNTLGYTLLREGKTAMAVAVFQANAALYPRSANSWDSLGEALAGAGRRSEAIAAYRTALRLDSNFASSQAGLERLGVR